MLEWIAKALGAHTARRAERIQSLWGGYGELFRVELEGGTSPTAVVKWARPPTDAADDVSFARKCRSFEVETAFYRSVAPRCDATCRVPGLLAHRGGAAEREWVLVLEDLDAIGFDRRIDEAMGPTLDAALAWLASFHARFVGEQIGTLWPIGTYWHLATRRDELAAIEDRSLRDAAPVFAERLASACYQTVLHGDPKEANFCVDDTGARVAAVDFQYTGRGSGVVDVAYLLYGRGDEPPDGIDRARLDLYFRHLRAALAPSIDGDALEAEWRELYPFARADFCRFLAGWRPASWRHDVRGQRFVRAMLARTSRASGT